MVKVTITAALEPEKSTANFYGVSNLNYEVIKLLNDYDINHLTLHVFSKEEAMQAVEFCARNSIEYRIGGKTNG